MRELRTQENEKFEKFFELIRKKANELGCIFFVDAGEGHELFLDDLEGEDLSGWLIPFRLADTFEIEWKRLDVDEKWNRFFTFAFWRYDNGEVTVFFQSF